MIATKMPPREGERNERRVLIRAKSNIGPDEGGQVHNLEQTSSPNTPYSLRAVLWGESCSMAMAQSILAEAESDGERALLKRTPRGSLWSFLSGGPAAAKEVQATARR